MPQRSNILLCTTTHTTSLPIPVYGHCAVHVKGKPKSVSGNVRVCCVKVNGVGKDVAMLSDELVHNRSSKPELQLRAWKEGEGLTSVTDWLDHQH